MLQAFSPPEVARAEFTRAQDALALASLRLLARQPQARRVAVHEAHVGNMPLVDVSELALQSLLLRVGVVDRAHGPRPEKDFKRNKTLSSLVQSRTSTSVTSQAGAVI